MFLLFKWTFVRLQLLNVYDFNVFNAITGNLHNGTVIYLMVKILYIISLS